MKKKNTFDQWEDESRKWLSHRPILYAFVGGIGLVIFWRGVWHTVDMLMHVVTYWGDPTIDLADLVWWDGPLSFLIGTLLLLITGIFVSSFIGNEVLLSGLKGEKKLAEKTTEELAHDLATTRAIRSELTRIESRIENLEHLERSRAKQKK